jgi:hypothetical protein
MGVAQNSVGIYWLVADKQKDVSRILIVLSS